MKKQNVLIIKLITLVVLMSACTKSRKAELADEQKSSVFAISEFGEASESSEYTAELIATDDSVDNSSNSLQAFNVESKARLHSHSVEVPNRMKFMFENLPVSNATEKKFKITFSVDKDYVTAYKISGKVAELSLLEKSIAVTAKELKIVSRAGKASAGQIKALSDERKSAQSEKNEIKSGKKAGVLLVPLFKYRIENYGIIERAKNELKEDTSRLIVKRTDWKDATHLQLSPQMDSRLVIGLNVGQSKQLKQIYSEAKLDNQITTAGQLQQKISVGMKFISENTKVYTRLDADRLLVYEITDTSKLNESQLRLLKNNAGNQTILSCQDRAVAAYIKNTDKNCAIVLTAVIPVAYKTAKLSEENDSGGTSDRIELEDVPRNQSIGLIEIRENTAARQVDISSNGILDPNSSIKLSDIKGEFYYRRTFESASNMFMGRTGTSGDLAIVSFELEDNRIVVRNQKSLISYTGQGPKDREELMSFPVSYFKMQTTDEMGNLLTVPVPQKSTKEKADYALIDWTNNTVPDAVSPLAFYSGGSCFAANSSLKVTDTDMRLEKDGVLNYSLSGSYTVKPTANCVAMADVNSAYWKGSYQFNFNVTERISFMKHKNPAADVQFSQNISSMAQEAFNFGVFTLADKVTGNGALDNRDGSEKYMPIIHDFRNGKKLRYYLGGINNPAVTDAERRQILVEGAQQVIAEWNKSLKLAFRGTSLERAEDYLELIIENQDTGHLGDLDRNYIWLNELPAENGLLGVAQPAANPRSGTIQAANVIIYTGNTFEQTRTLLKLTKLSREYEQNIEKYKAELIEQVKKQQEVQKKATAVHASGDATVPAGVTTESVEEKADFTVKNLDKIIESLQLDNKKVKAAIKGLKTNPNIAGAKKLRTLLSQDFLKQYQKSKKTTYPINNLTFIKKMTDVAVQKAYANNDNLLELELNKAMLETGGLDQDIKQILIKRSQMLQAAVQFDENNQNRPGCFMYARNDIQDKALTLDADPHVNLMRNFKSAFMSTLSHELGHAFGLLHNFKASTDKANYEFKDEKTGRNYSSIMDYITDVDQHYAGPGPYDVHAIRAAYTGMVEAGDLMAKHKVFGALKADQNNLVSIADILKTANASSLVHFNKDTLNREGVIKFYEQCSEGGLSESALCAQFDSGSSATEIVQNLIADYNRGYQLRNYVHDKILFSTAEKIQIINRSISQFRKIRSYLDEAIMTLVLGTGLPKEQSGKIVMDRLNAAKLGYIFFHELIRTPDAIGKDGKAISQSDLKARLKPVLYKYSRTKADGKGKEEVQDIKILEARSVNDINMTRDKIDTIGIGFDKAFAMMFLLQASAPKTDTEAVANSSISYINFEQWILGIQDPTESITMHTLMQILSKNLAGGFFAPSDQFENFDFRELDMSVRVNRFMADQTAVGAIIGLDQAAKEGFDSYAQMFKVGKSTVAQAPKDRYNVIKQGNDRSLSDSRVLFAAQNAAGADALVTVATKNEYYMSLKSDLSKQMLELYQADAAYRTPINKIKAEICSKGKETDACKAAMEKSTEDYLKENEELQKLKEKADELAAALVAKLRELNKESGLIITEEMDAEDSALNLANQVEQMREVLAINVDMILTVKSVLESVPVEQVRPILENIKKVFEQIRAKNDELGDVHLIALSFSVISDLAKNVPVTLKNGQQITVSDTDLISVLVDSAKLADDLELQMSVIEKLSMLTGIVDEDAILK